MTRKRVHLVRAASQTYCGHEGEMTDDVEKVTCVNCLRFWRLAEQRKAKGLGH